MEYHIKPFSVAIATVLIFNISSYAFAESAAGGGGGAGNIVLEEIVVTAQKREQSLRDIAASISVVSGQAISDYNVLDFTELENVTSGLFLTRVNARNSTVSLRGLRVDPESGSEAAVDIYLNGVSVRPRVAFGQMYDIERVEVLRGPQGAFQGKSSPAGSIQIHTRSPDLDEVGGYIQAQAGSNDALKYQGAVNVPVIEGKLAIRIAGDHDRNDGDEIVNLITGRLQDHESESVRFSVAWRPSDNFNATFKYDYIDRLDYDAKPLAGSRTTLSSPMGATPTPCTFAGNIPAAATCRILTPEDRAALAATDDFSEFNADIYNLHANWYFGNHKLTYIFGLVDSEQFSPQENDATFNLGLQNALYGLHPNPNYRASFRNDFRTFQTSATSVDAKVHELRLESDREGRWQYMVGLYVDTQETLTPFTSWSAAARYVPLNVTVPIPANPMFRLPGYDLTFTGGVIVGANFSTTGSIPFDSDTRALFTHHAIEVSERTTLEVALRYSEVERFAQTNIAFGAFFQEELIERQGLITYTTSIPLPPAVTEPTANAVAIGFQLGFLNGLRAVDIQAIPPEHETFEDEVFTGTLSVRYEQSESLYFYGSYSRGYRIGGISVVPATFALPSALLLYDPEDSDAIEVGLKADFWGGRGSVNAALFYQQLDNHFGYVVELTVNPVVLLNNTLPPGTSPDIPGGLVFNGDAISKGIEIEGRLLLGDNLLLGMGVNYVNVEWDSALAPCNVHGPSEIVGSCDISGQRIAGEPEFSLNINAEYRVPISGDTSAFVRATYKYKGDIVSTAAQTTSEPPRETDAYSIFNLFVGIELADNWEITLWGKNLFDEDARTDLRTRGDGLDSAADFEQVLQVPQRTYGIITRYTF